MFLNQYSLTQDNFAPIQNSLTLIPEVKQSNIRSSNNFEMDKKLKFKEESFPDDVAPQNETEFFSKVVIIKRNSDAVLVDDCCDVPIKTEIKSETPFAKHFIKQIKSEAVTCSSSSSSCEIDRKASFDEETLISDFGSQSKRKLLSEDPVAKLGKFNSGHEMGNKIEIKEEPLWPETDTSDLHDDIKDRDFPPLNSSRLCNQGASSAVSGKSLLIAAEVSGKGTSFSPGKDYPEYEHQNSDDIQIPSAEEHVLSEQFSTCSGKRDMYIRPLNLKQKTLTHQRKRPHKYETSDKSCLAAYKAHSLIHEGKKPHQCKTCDKSFLHLSHLKTHSLIHEGQKPHQCKTCDKRFTQLSNLKTHYLIHEGKKPHQCTTCDKSFNQVSYLKRHSLIHEDMKPHQCKTCDKSFTLLGNLKAHSLIHEGKKPHQCKTCDKRFTQLSNLKAHYLIHEGKKTHQCTTCDKSFNQVSYLKRHSLIHEDRKPHQCKTCDKSFTLLGNLKAHSLIHEGKKPHQCKTCDKSFTRLSHLERHHLIHESKKPHRCKTCNKNFSTLSNLKRHSIQESKQ